MQRGFARWRHIQGFVRVRFDPDQSNGEMIASAYLPWMSAT
jgi:hypothetical protein